MKRIAFLASLSALLAAGNPPVRVDITPRVGIGPVKEVRIRATVEPHADNRLLRIVIDNGETYLRSSDYQLDGLDAPRTHSLELKNVPGGNYLVVAAVFGPGGKVRYVAKLEVEYRRPFDGQ